MAEVSPAAWRPGESKFAPELGQTICTRVEAGESLAAICRDPGMPTANTVRNWTRAHPAFGATLMGAAKVARIVERQRDQQIWDAREAARHWLGRRSSYQHETGEMICLRLAHGESLISIARDPEMPTYATILKWVGRHLDFQDMYVEARRMQADYLFDESRDVVRSATPRTVAVARLQFDAIRWQTARLAPKKYCEKLVVEAARAEDEIDRIVVVKFTEGPNGEPLVLPPRCEDEERRWEAAYGRPYDGPRP